MFNGISSLLTGLFFTALFAVMCLVGVGAYFIFTPNQITSDKPIQPKTELVIKNNQVDTIYIYENK